jgi:hypothetical protein
VGFGFRSPVGCGIALSTVVLALSELRTHISYELYVGGKATVETFNDYFACTA